MAAIARLIRHSIDRAFAAEGDAASSDSQLHLQFKSFQRLLIKDLTPADFADMYAQTICYGLFAAWVNLEGQPFSRQTAAYSIPPTNPFMRWLFGHLAGPGMDARIAWAVDDLVELFNRAQGARVMEGFGRGTQQEDPVVHFYETFLQAYDPAARELRGVYYTPEPVVSYIVRSVDHILRTDFGCPMGLAQDTRIGLGADAPHRVLILDPACGTGTFLLQVFESIRATIQEMHQQGAWQDYVRRHLLPRVFGFELLMAPYAVAHLKLGLWLKEAGYAFHDKERLGIYLTNALEKAHPQPMLDPFQIELSREMDAADRAKAALPIMVVLGNPPYSGHSANKVPWMDKLLRGIDTGAGQDGATGTPTESYFHVDGKPLRERNSKWLNNDYVKFIRWAQWRITRTGQGVLAFITSHSYLDSATFRGMRQSLLHTFDQISVLDLHGNSVKGETCPDGSPDGNVFDIQQGVVVGLFVKTGGERKGCVVRHATVWGRRQAKYDWLWGHDVRTTTWETLQPQAPFYLFLPQNRALLGEYNQGYKVTEAMATNVLGFQTHRDNFAIAFERETMVRRVEQLLEPSVSDEALATRYGLKNNRDWQLARARENLMASTTWERRIIRCLYRSFDWRYCHFGPDTMDYPRRELDLHVAGRANLCLGIGRQGLAVNDPQWSLVAVSREPIDANIFRRGGINVFPLYLYPERGTTADATTTPGGRWPNLAAEFVKTYEAELKLAFLPDGLGDLQTTFGPEDLFHYMYAVLHAPAYRARYAEFLKLDFPRLPITGNLALFRALCPLGAELVALHLMESPKLDTPSTRFPASGDGKVERVVYTDPQGSDAGRVTINKTQYFDGIAPEVWAFTVGGYQVLDKWLKDRKGRALSYDDVRHYQRIVVALTETKRLMEEIDATIEEHGGWPIV
jgi:predicted helicase